MQPSKAEAQFLSALTAESFASCALIGEYPERLPVPTNAFSKVAAASVALPVVASTPVLVADLPKDTDWQAELGSLVSRLCPVIVWLAPLPTPLTKTDLLALAFSPAGFVLERPVYRYALDSYNPRREWNNADNWAHPDNYR